MWAGFLAGALATLVFRPPYPWDGGSEAVTSNFAQSAAAGIGFAILARVACWLYLRKSTANPH